MDTKVSSSIKILNFLRGTGVNSSCKFLWEVQTSTDAQLEISYDAIEWLFPVDYKGGIINGNNTYFPMLSAVDCMAMRDDQLIKNNLYQSLIRMMQFYDRNNHWITTKNYNYLRILRILRCLWLVEMKKEYVCLQKCLDKLYTSFDDIIGEEMYLRWKSANIDEVILGGKTPFCSYQRLPDDCQEFFGDEHPAERYARETGMI